MKTFIVIGLLGIAIFALIKTLLDLIIKKT
jgi:hypothetical protein